MSPPISFTKATLSYPVYSVDFDPYNRGYLVVGGGGGEGRSGVSNKITLLDTSSRSKLDVVAEIDLSRDEDSVTSIANLASKDGLITLAGINSSEAEQKSGKNEHLRAFDVRYPKRRKTEKDAEEEGKISLLGKSSLFKPARGPKPEQYQRLLKLSPAQKTPTGSRRIGVVATGLAKQSQLVVFDATKTPVKESEIINAIDLDAEAADLDVITTNPSTYSIAWCTDYSVFEQSMSYDSATGQKELMPKGPRNVYTLPKEDPTGKTKVRSRYRSIRFLTDHHLLVLSNLPNKAGAEVSILHLYPTGPAAIVFHKILPSRIKQAAGMDVCGLAADNVGSRQFVVAVAGQDISIEVYTINYTRQTDTFSPFKRFTTLRDVHPLQMTAIRFAPYFAPEVPKDAKNIPDQYIRLASTSMGNTVVVDTFAIQQLENKPKSRHVLSHPSDVRRLQMTYAAMISVIVLVTAILLQSAFFPDSSVAMMEKLPRPVRMVLDGTFAETMRGAGGQAKHATDQAVGQAKLATDQAVNQLRDAIKLHGSDPAKAIVLQAPKSGSDLDMQVVHDKAEYRKQDDTVKHWHELGEHEKHEWRRALTKAGQWTADEGEAVLKGILFGSYAGFIGQVAGEVIREL